MSKEKDLKIIKDFISYLDSDTEKYSINYGTPFVIHSYSDEIIDFIIYWNESSYLQKDYLERVKSYGGTISDIKAETLDLDMVLVVITYILRQERFSGGIIASNLDLLKRLLERLILLEN